MKGKLLHLADEVPADGEQEDGVAEGEGGRRTPGDGNPLTAQSG